MHALHKAASSSSNTIRCRHLAALNTACTSCIANNVLNHIVFIFRTRHISRHQWYQFSNAFDQGIHTVV